MIARNPAVGQLYYDQHSKSLRLHSLPCRGRTLREDITEDIFPQDSNCCVSSESCNAIQSTRAFATKIGCTSGELTFHFCILYVICLDAGPFSISDALDRMLLQPGLVAFTHGHRWAPARREPYIQSIHQAH